MKHRWGLSPRCLIQAGVALSLFWVGLAQAGVFDQCGILFESRDPTARLRRFYPGTKPTTSQADLEARQDYLIVFKLPTSYIARSGRLVADIKLMPMEGRIDLLQVGEQLFEIVRSAGRGPQSIELRKGELTQAGWLSGERVLTNGQSTLAYSEASQPTQLTGASEPPPVSARFDFDLASLERATGIKWQNINSADASGSE